jgi:transcriptional regulator with XRE-family HTH domain
MDIYIRIKELREEKKLTQKVVSGLINIDSSQYSKIELGKLQPTLTQIMAISSFFEVSMDWLCFGKKVEKQEDKGKIAILDRENAMQAKIIEGLEFKVDTLEKELSTIKQASKEPILYRSVAEPAPELIKKEPK